MDIVVRMGTTLKTAQINLKRKRVRYVSVQRSRIVIRADRTTVLFIRWLWNSTLIKLTMASNLSNKNGRLLLRIGQVNIGRSKTTTEELKQIMTSKRLDVVLLQEPYCMDHKIRGLGLNIKVVEDSDRAPWSRITKVQAGIAITKTDITVTKLVGSSDF